MLSATPDYPAHIAKLKKKVSSDFTIVVEKPFVVIGDEPEARVRSRAQGTVRWVVQQLKADFFSKDPDHIIDIWLFKDRGSYNKHTLRLFGERPDTPYGYYSPQHRALVMNIATGGGTLVHEIVHPFMEANFEDCPPWFNEGLGSLYEQCGERDGKIHGFTNWRLAGLQEAFRANEVPSFRTLTAASTSDFYGRDPGTNYSQARYLLYYLQERGLLRKYYRAFYKARRTDPSGFKTLKDILQEKDMRAFQARWERYVMKLRFP